MSGLWRGRGVAVARSPAQLLGEQQRPLLGVALPVRLVPLMGQVPAAHPLLKRPQVTPQLEVLLLQRKHYGMDLCMMC